MGCIKETDLGDLDASKAAKPATAQANQDHDGDPVNLVTGAFTLAEVDLLISSQRLNLSVVRYYHSQQHNDALAPGDFGWGWSHSFAMRLDIGKDDCTYVDDRGVRLRFVSGTAGGNFVAPPGALALRLERSVDGNFRLRQGDGLCAHFESSGQLVALVRPGPEADSRLALTYDSAGQLHRVEGAGGRFVEFGRVEGSNLVRSVTDHTGRAWHYEYDDEQLIVVRTPAGCVRRYTYRRWVGDVATSVPGGKVRAPELRPRVIRGMYQVFSPVGDGNKQGPAVVTNQYTSNFRVHRQIDALGHVTRFDYNPYTRIVSVTDPEGWSTSHNFDANGNTTRLRTAEGFVTEYIYDDRGNLLAEIDPLGHRTEFVSLRSTAIWDRVSEFGRRAFGNRSEYVTLRAGDIAEGYDDLGRRPLVRDALGRTTRFTDYDEFGTPRRTRLPDGSTLDTDTDPRSGQPLRRVWQAESVAAGRRIETWSYDPIGNVREHRFYWEGPDGARGPVAVETFDYDDDGHHPSSCSRWVVAPDGASSPILRERFAWSPRGELVNRVVEYCRRPGAAIVELSTRYGYDELSRQVWAIHPDGVAEGIEYDDAGNLVETFRVSQATPDLIARVPAEQRQARYQWHHDDMGRVFESIDPKGLRRTIFRDAFGRPERVEEPNGSFATYEYDRDGQVIVATTSSGDRVAIKYDAVGRVVSTRDCFGADLGWAYDELGRISSSRVQAATTTFARNEAARTIQRTSADGAWEVLQFDAWDRMVAREHGPDAGLIERFAYDGLDRVVRIEAGVPSAPGLICAYRHEDVENQTVVTDALGGENVVKMDVLGRPVERTDPDGRCTILEFDVWGRIVSRRSGDGGFDARYRYNCVGDLIEATEGEAAEIWDRDPAGYLHAHHQQIGTHRFSIRYRYDTHGRLEKKSADGGWWMTYVYHRASSFPSRLVFPGRSVDLRVDARGRVLEEHWDDGSAKRYGFAPDGELIYVADSDASENLTFSQNVNLDALGRPGIESRFDGARQEQLAYRYDSQGRLACIERREGENRHEYRRYVYDALGNREEEHRDGRLWRTWRFDAAQRIVDVIDGVDDVLSFDFDRSGNLVERGDRRVAYDAVGRMSRIEDRTNHRPLAEYHYGALNRPVEVASPAGVSRRFYDGDQVIAIQSPSNVEHAWWKAVDQLVAWRESAGSPTNSVRTDRLGSVIGVGDSMDGPAYGPFGEIDNTVTGGPSFGFHGKLLEKESGLWYNRARYYDPAVGRFTQPDPLGVVDGLNLYIFARNNPVAFIDLDGFRAIRSPRTSAGSISQSQQTVGSPRRVSDQQMIHRAGGGGWENLKLSNADKLGSPPGVSVLFGASPKDVRSKLRPIAESHEPLYKKAMGAIGSALVASVRATGFDVIDTSNDKSTSALNRMRMHGLIIHPEGIVGFSNDNLMMLSTVFKDDPDNVRHDGEQSLCTK
jgi:RHS repeat-associated protein